MCVCVCAFVCLYVVHGIIIVVWCSVFEGMVIPYPKRKILTEDDNTKEEKPDPKASLANSIQICLCCKIIVNLCLVKIYKILFREY